MMLKPEFYRTPVEESVVLLRSRLHDQERAFLQREEDWASDLRESMDREEGLRARLHQTRRESKSLVDLATVSLSVEIEQHRQRVQMLEGEVHDLTGQLERATEIAVSTRLASVACSWVCCTEKRHGGWRFCKPHLDEARKELSSGGYLQSVPWRGGGVRTPDMMEDVNETKYGVSDGTEAEELPQVREDASDTGACA